MKAKTKYTLTKRKKKKKKAHQKALRMCAIQPTNAETTFLRTAIMFGF